MNYLFLQVVLAKPSATSETLLVVDLCRTALGQAAGAPQSLSSSNFPFPHGVQ